MEDAKGRWVRELPSVLWVFRTTPCRSIGETPISLACGTKAVTPLEVGLPTLRTMQVEAGENDAALEESLDFADDKRVIALIRLANYHQKLSRQRQGHIKSREFQVSNLILKKNMGSMIDPNHDKLVANWEGPYKVIGTTDIGAYYLEAQDGRAIPNPWNISNLRK